MDERVFKRINLFKGFIRTTRDYKGAVAYHLRKHRLHNRTFHSYGVVPGVTGELEVRQRRRVELAVEVRPGYALDPQGQDVVVREVEIKRLVKEDFVLPQTIYLVLRYHEQESDFRQIRIPGFPERDGFARVEEAYRVDWTIAEPDPRRELELCRILLTEDTVAIRDAENPLKPRAGEIDRRYVRNAAVCRGTTAGVSAGVMSSAFKEASRTQMYLSRTRDLSSAASVATGCVSLSALSLAQVVNGDGVLRAMSMLRRLQQESITEVTVNEPALSRRKRFREYIESVEQSGEVLDVMDELGPGEKAEAAQMVVGTQLSGMSALDELVSAPAPMLGQALEEMKPGTGIRVLDGTDWERLKIESRMPALSMVVEGREWRLIDSVNLLEAESERAHEFAIREAFDWYRSQLKLKYPDGALVNDDGIGHRGGYATWEVHNVTPGLPLVIMRRMDYGRGDYWCRIWINDVEAGEVPCHGEDTRYRWRNWPFYVHPHFVRHRVVRVKQAIETANRDVNFFRLWFYQPY